MANYSLSFIKKSLLKIVILYLFIISFFWKSLSIPTYKKLMPTYRKSRLHFHLLSVIRDEKVTR